MYQSTVKYYPMIVIFVEHLTLNNIVNLSYSAYLLKKIKKHCFIIYFFYCKLHNIFMCVFRIIYYYVQDFIRY